jgi:hypothetical protein
VKPASIAPTTSAGTAVSCAIRAFATAQASSQDIVLLRQDLTAPPKGLPASLVKHADDQTIVALAVIFRAIERHQLVGTDFRDWAVLASPRYLGRSSLAGALQRYQAEGAWGVSPHLIPHRSMHAVSGSISQALGIHGANLGVGGGLNGAAEIFMAAATLLADKKLPGLWAIITGLDPEPQLDDLRHQPLNGQFKTRIRCNGLALALTPLPRPGIHASLHVFTSGIGRPERDHSAAEVDTPFCRLENLLPALGGPSPLPGEWNLLCGAWMRLQHGSGES